MKILLVDNDEKTLSFLEGALVAGGHKIIKVNNGETAVECLGRNSIDLIFLAAVMPGTPGFVTAQKIKSKHAIPIIMLTGLKEKEDIVQGVASGADDFLSKPFVKEELLLKVRNFAKVRESQDTVEGIISKRANQLKSLLKKAFELNRELIFRILTAAEYKDDETGKHIVRVGKYARLVAEKMSLKGEFLELIETAAAMHDLGKIGIPDRMLLKTGKLTAGEFDIIKSHTVIGAAILEGSSSPLINMAHDIALSHHEKWDGTGYPAGLKGPAIPLPARIVAVCDIFDALTSSRPYKPSFSWDKSLIIIREGRGKIFDPEVVDAFVNKILEIETVYREHRDVERKAGEAYDIERIR